MVCHIIKRSNGVSLKKLRWKKQVSEDMDDVDAYETNIDYKQSFGSVFLFQNTR